MNFTLSGILAGLIFGSFGFYFIKKGKAEGELPTMLIGAALLVYPYFIENDYLLWGIGAILMTVAFKQPW